MANKDNKEKELFCSFCGRSQSEVEQIIIGPGVNICKECIEMCWNVMNNSEDKRRPPKAGPRGKNAAAPAVKAQPVACAALIDAVTQK